MCTFLNLLQRAQVIHPVQFCLLFDKIVAADQNIDLVGGLSERGGQLRANELSCGLHIGLVACAIL